MVSMMAAALLLTASAARVVGQELAHPAHEGPSVSIPANGIKFLHTGQKTDKGELLAGPAYGDFQHGPHGTFFRFPHGFISPPHTHTADYYAVVIKGVGSNHPPGVDPVPLPAGSYWFQKGEEAHVTQCLSQTDCLFFVVQQSKFDTFPAK
jgi:hypothetical protein